MSQREARIRFEAGDADFRLAALTGTETLSGVYSLWVEVLHPHHTVSLSQILGTRITVTLDAHAGAVRHIDGFVADATYLGPSQDRVRYGLTVVPWLWFLSKRQDCRIFQNLTVPDIVGQVFRGYSIADHVERLGERYEPRPYCVQYRESDLDFVCRLLEHEGITFFFEHSDGAHRLVLTDPATPARDVSGYASLPYYPPDPNVRRERDHLDAWRAQARVQPSKATLRAFDFEKPRADLQACESDPKQHSHADAEVYDYADCYVALGRGETLARTRLEELQAGHQRSTGSGNAAGLCCGARFRLTGFPRQDQNTEWLIVSVRHDIRIEAPRSGGEAGTDEPYRAQIEVQDSKTAFRPPRLTPRPLVHGPQTAMVTGPAGEEIYTDKYGRVKVQFHWDRQGKRDANTSCWVRVSSAWAGSGWGGIQIPRIGQEVIVDFLEGDPDRPIITGRVYNAASMPPYGLPGSATQSGMKSNSSKGGGGSNELRFEDSKGSEEMYLHAQKDQTIVVEHDKTETVHQHERRTIDHDRTDHVGDNEMRSVGQNRTRTVGANETVTVGAAQAITVHGVHVHTVDLTETRLVKAGRVDTVMVNEARTVIGPQEQTVAATRTVKVGASQSHTVGAGDSWNITGGQTENIMGEQATKVSGDRTLSAGGNRSVSVTGNDSLSIGGDRSAAVKGNRSAAVDGNDGLKVKGTLSMDADGSVTLTSAKEITIKAGKAVIHLAKDGNITINGKDLHIEGSGKIDQLAKGGNLTQKGQKILQN